MPKVIFTQNTRHGARGEMAYIDEAAPVERATSLPMLTWADWELLQELHKDRAVWDNVRDASGVYPAADTPNSRCPATPAEPAPEADRHAPVESYESVCRRLRHATEERDRALVQVTVYRKAYYNLLHALSAGHSLQAILDAVRIIDAAVKDHENQ